jgi:hypothetical protein
VGKKGEREREKLKSKTSSRNNRSEIAKKKSQNNCEKGFFSLLAQPEFNESILAMKSGFYIKLVCSRRQKKRKKRNQENFSLTGKEAD